MKCSMQNCIKSDIEVLRKDTDEDFKLVIHMRIGTWPNLEIIVIALIL